jgi:hypothetical protein
MEISCARSYPGFFIMDDKQWFSMLYFCGLLKKYGEINAGNK